MPGPRPIGYWVKAVDRLIDAEFTSAAADAGITRRQWQILNVLLDRGAASRPEVARALAPFLPPGESLDAHSLDAHLGAITAAPGRAGSAALVTAADDRLELTAAGRGRLDQVRAHSVRQLRDRVAVGLTREDYDTTLRTLEQIARNLGWSEDA
jgi:DNA-binding MarR family transcriptional regulator